MSEKLLGRNCSWCSWATPSKTRRNLELCDSCSEHFDEGATNERERIIALLEHERYYTNGDDQFETAHSVPCVTCKNIALIKGENE